MRLVKQGKSVISIHAPPRGATLQAALRIGRNGKFQFTPLREGRPGAGGIRYMQHQFQFTPLREGRRQIYHNCQANGLFQFTPLREGRRVKDAS